MADYLGFFNTATSRTTVRFKFTTHASSGAAVAPSSAFEAADVRIYKDDSATERSSVAGITMTSPFDSVVGLHHVSIDLTDNTDAGFYAAGSTYEAVLVPDETVDSVAVVRVLARWEIGRPQTDVRQWNNTAVPAENTAGYPIVTVKDGTGTGEINTNAGKVVGVELVDVLTTYTGNTVQTGDSFARLGLPAGASVSADIAAIEAQTDDIGAAGAGLTAVPWNAAWDAEVQSEVDDALVAQRLDELLNADSDIDGAAPPTVGSVFHELLTSTAGSFTYDQTTDSLEAIRDRGDAAWTGGGGGGLDAAGVRAALGMASANLDTQLSTIDTVVDAIKVKTDSLTFTVAGQADSNVHYVNNVLVTGTGAGGDEWGP